MPGYDLKKVKFTTDGAIFERVVVFRRFFWVGRVAGLDESE